MTEIFRLINKTQFLRIFIPVKILSYSNMQAPDPGEPGTITPGSLGFRAGTASYAPVQHVDSYES